jgi:hypothetical protein
MNTGNQRSVFATLITVTASFYCLNNSFTVLPWGRNFGSKTQKGPKNFLLWGRENLGPGTELFCSLVFALKQSYFWQKIVTSH